MNANLKKIPRYFAFLTHSVPNEFPLRSSSFSCHLEKCFSLLLTPSWSFREYETPLILLQCKTSDPVMQECVSSSWTKDGDEEPFT